MQTAASLVNPERVVVMNGNALCGLYHLDMERKALRPFYACGRERGRCRTVFLHGGAGPAGKWINSIYKFLILENFI